MLYQVSAVMGRQLYLSTCDKQYVLPGDDSPDWTSHNDLEVCKEKRSILVMPGLNSEIILPTVEAALHIYMDYTMVAV